MKSVCCSSGSTDDQHCNTISTKAPWRFRTHLRKAIYVIFLQGFGVSTTLSQEDHTEKYTDELIKKTEDYGDCCMTTLLEWGH